MSVSSTFDCLPNELYLCIFDYLNSIDLLYSFSNVNSRLNSLLKSYSRLTLKHIDLTKLNRRVLQFYSSKKRINDQIISLRLNDEQFQSIDLSTNNRLRHLDLFLQNNYHLQLKQHFLFEYLEKLTVEDNALTWIKPMIICQNLKQVKIHLKNHSDLIELIHCLPVVQKVHATIDYEVTNCRDNCSSQLYSYSKNLIDFSYIINQRYGLVYFVTDYSMIESLVRQLTNLLNLRLYIIGCLNTSINGLDLQKNLLKYLPNLKEFHFYLQSYGGIKLKSMEQFEDLKWNFGSYTNDLTDMIYLFTLPYQFERLDQCLNQYFIKGIKTTFTKSQNEIVNEKLIGMNYVKHIHLSCDITLNLLILLQELFTLLESIHFSSSTSEYSSPPSLARQSRYLLKSIKSVTFDLSCRNQYPIICLLPNLNKLIISQSLLNNLLDKIGPGYVYQISQLYVYQFQRHYLEDIMNGFANVRHLVLKTISTDDEGPIRSFLNNHCHHKHRPVSITDILEELFQNKLTKLKEIEIGCCFERDEEQIVPILSRIITKYYPQNILFHIKSEDFKSSRCGTILISFYN